MIREPKTPNPADKQKYVLGAAALGYFLLAMFNAYVHRGSDNSNEGFFHQLADDFDFAKQKLGFQK